MFCFSACWQALNWLYVGRRVKKLSDVWRRRGIHPALRIDNSERNQQISAAHVSIDLQNTETLKKEIYEANPKFAKEQKNRTSYYTKMRLRAVLLMRASIKSAVKRSIFV